MAIYGGTTGRIALAQTLGQSGDMAFVNRAIGLDPGDPELHYRAALLRLLRTSETSSALRELRRAIELNPRQARYWLALGQTCYVLGDDACASEALEAAVRSAPMRPGLEWQAVSYYSAAGDYRRFSAHAARLLELHPDSAREVCELAWRAGESHDPRWIGFAEAARDLRVRGAVLDSMAVRGRYDLAMQYWMRTAGGATSPATESAFAALKPFLRRLLNDQRFEDAARVWRDLVRMGVVLDDAGDPGNLVFNGRFARPLLNAGFDWQTQEQPYVHVSVTGAHGKAEQPAGSSLRIDFSLPWNAEYEPVTQLVPLRAGREYEFSARVRSEQITSDSGPRFRILDPQCPTCFDVTSEATLGTTDWHETRLRIVVPPGTEVLRLSVWRPRSRTFPMEIAGRFYVQSVSLRPLSSGLPADDSADR